MIRLECRLEAIIRQCVRQAEHTSVEDEHIQRTTGAQKQRTQHRLHRQPFQFLTRSVPLSGFPLYSESARFQGPSK